MKTKRQIS